MAESNQSFFLGAYATSPNSKVWNAQVEAEYYQALKKSPYICGLEHPFVGTLHPSDDAWFLDHIKPEWDYVFTCIPGLMGRLEKNPHFGLASDHERGRLDSIDFYRSAFHAVEKLNAHLGRQSVRAIQVHSGPSRKNNISSSQDSFVKSLQTISQWDWKDCRILVEHCDAYKETQTPAKGFLRLKEEIAALEFLNQTMSQPVKILINWGRSVLEGRSTQTVLDHLNMVKDAGLLEGIIFSGVTNEDNPWGIWKDSHVPPAPFAGKSLLTKNEIQACFEIVNPKSLSILGLKITSEPEIFNLERSVQLNLDSLDLLYLCANGK